MNITQDAVSTALMLTMLSMLTGQLCDTVVSMVTSGCEGLQPFMMLEGGARDMRQNCRGKEHKERMLRASSLQPLLLLLGSQSIQ